MENQGFSNLVIYAVKPRAAGALGLATGNSSKSFPIPNYLIRGAGTLRFLADPVGGTRTPVSEEICGAAG